MVIKCCKDCKPPKRYIGCHADCIDYIMEKAVYNAAREADNEKRRLNDAIVSQRCKKIREATKRKRN